MPQAMGIPWAKGISSQAQHRLFLFRISTVSCSPVFQVCLLTLRWGRKACPAAVEVMPKLLGKQAKSCVALTQLIIFIITFYWAPSCWSMLEVIKLTSQGNKKMGLLIIFFSLPCDSRNDQQREAKQASEWMQSYYTYNLSFLKTLTTLLTDRMKL